MKVVYIGKDVEYDLPPVFEILLKNEKEEERVVKILNHLGINRYEWTCDGNEQYISSVILDLDDIERSFGIGRWDINTTKEIFMEEWKKAKKIIK